MAQETERLVGWLESNVPFQQIYGYIRDKTESFETAKVTFKVTGVGATQYPYMISY